MERTLKEILARGREVAVLVVGDLILDEYLWGNIERISPEAPVPVLEWTGENLSLGGAANVAHNLQHLGARVLLVGVVGTDENAGRLKRLLQQSGIDTGGIFEDPSRPTTSKMRVLAHNQQILRIDKEAQHEVSAPVEKSIRDYLAHALPRVAGVICSDYRKGLLKESLVRSLIAGARAAGRPVVIDPKGADYTRYCGATALTPNLREAEAAAGARIGGEEDLPLVAERLFGATDCRHLLITRGKDGMTLCSSNRVPSSVEPSGVKSEDARRTTHDAPTLTHIPTHAREVFDVTGAGDTVISVFGLGLCLGSDPLSAAQLANLAAGIVVGKLGTAPISWDELAKAVDERALFQHRKLLPLRELKPLLNLARNQGKQVVFTNGCFDLLHVGHIHYLQQARALGNLLVVGLSSDASVRQLKGPERPLISQEERANVLAALSCVDYVILFDETPPEHLLAQLRPDVLVKGGDSGPETVAGQEIVEAYGGKVEIIPYIPSRSSSSLVEQIVNQYKLGVRD